VDVAKHAADDTEEREAVARAEFAVLYEREEALWLSF
jgi:hypothetical protein